MSATIFNRPKSTSTSSDVSSAEVTQLQSDVSTLQFQKFKVWSAGSYALGQIVVYQNVLYRALTGTSTTPGSNDWTSDLTGLKPADNTFQLYTGQSFTVGQYCLSNSNLYKALSTTSAAPPTAAWILVLSGESGDTLATSSTLARRNADGTLTAAAPSLAGHVATKQYTDSLVSGLSWKNSVRVKTAAPLPAYTRTTVDKYTANAVGVLTIDGVAVVLNDRVLITQVNLPASDSGIFYVSRAGTAGVAWILDRAADALTLPAGTGVAVAAGTTAALFQFLLTTENVIVGTTDQNWVRFASSVVELSGEATGSSSSVVLSNSAVISKVLTGLNPISGTVLATDSILGSVNKLAGTLNAATSSNVGSTLVKRDGAGTIAAGKLDVNGILDFQATGQKNRMISLVNTGNRTDPSDYRYYGFHVNGQSQIVTMVEGEAAHICFKYANSATATTDFFKASATGIVTLDRAGGGLLLPSPTGITSLLNHYEEYDWDAPFTLGSYAVNNLIKVVRVGKNVTLSQKVPILTNTAGGTASHGVWSGLPTRFCPQPDSVGHAHLVQIFNQGAYGVGMLTVYKIGTVHVSASVADGNFTMSSGYVGMQQCFSISYNVA